jgi:hypothetical protein
VPRLATRTKEFDMSDPRIPQKAEDAPSSPDDRKWLIDEFLYEGETCRIGANRDTIIKLAVRIINLLTTATPNRDGRPPVQPRRVVVYTPFDLPLVPPVRDLLTVERWAPELDSEVDLYEVAETLAAVRPELVLFLPAVLGEFHSYDNDEDADLARYDGAEGCVNIGAATLLFVERDYVPEDDEDDDFADVCDDEQEEDDD